MSRHKIGFLAISLLAIFVISGCAVRTYKVTKARVDQEVGGNRGYLSGQAPADVKPSSTTRETYVLEVEMGTPGKYQVLSLKKPGKQTVSTTQDVTSLNEDFLAEETEVEELAATFKTYKVKAGDTLQKISKEFYGTYKKWQKIYNANKEKIANPNSIKPGMTLNIPE